MLAMQTSTLSFHPEMLSPNRNTDEKTRDKMKKYWPEVAFRPECKTLKEIFLLSLYTHISSKFQYEGCLDMTPG